LDGYAEVISKSLIIPDGIGLSWALKGLNGELIFRYPGVEIVYDLSKLAARLNKSIFLLGAREGVAKKAGKELHSLTGVEIAGQMHGFFEKNDKSSLKICEQIKKSKADILFIGLGAPEQERWLKEYFEKTDVSIAIGVGGSMDIYSGKRKRAPSIIQKANLEWLYRILQNPVKKLKVVGQIIKFVHKVLFKGKK